MPGVRSLFACTQLLTLCVFLSSRVDAGAIGVRGRRGTPQNESTTGQEAGTTEASDGGDHGEGEHTGLRYRVAKFDFAHVAGPLVVTGWILLASIAKIGEFGATSVL